MEKRLTKEVHIGNRVIGGANPILIQSMTNTKTEDVVATVAQIQKLTKAGCDIIRCAVPTMDAAKALLDRLDAIEPNLSQQFRKSFNEHPIVKFKGYMKKATEYEKAAEKQSN